MKNDLFGRVEVRKIGRRNDYFYAVLHNGVIIDTRLRYRIAQASMRGYLLSKVYKSVPKDMSWSKQNYEPVIK